MKLNPRFVVGMVIVLVLVFIAHWQIPQRFVWNPSFRHADKQPFGCYVMDSLITMSVPQGYTVTDKTLYQLDRETGNKAIGILVVTDNLHSTPTDTNTIKRLLKKGCTVMIMAGWTNENFDDAFGVGTYDGGGFTLSTVKRMLANGYGVDTVQWVGHPNRYTQRDFKILRSIIPGSLEGNKNKKYETLYNKKNSVWIGDSVMEWADAPAAIAIPRGKGKLVVGCDPLLFTNYTVLNDDNAHLVFRLLSEVDSLPLVRTEAYLNNDKESQLSPLRYFLSVEPLRWMVWLTVAGLVLFFICTSRRRQRVIPVMGKPVNKSMEFVELIGSLYHQWHDNRDLVRKKYMFFAETMRRQLMIDVDDEASDGQTIDILAVHTGLRREVLRQRLVNLRQAIAEEEPMADDEMERFIDEMVEIEQLVGITN